MWKKLVLMIVAISFLSMMIGCSVSKEAVKGETAYYQAVKEVLMKKMENGNQPLLKIEAKDPTKDMVFSNVASITVFAPPAPQIGPLIPQFVHQEMEVAKAYVPIVGTVAAGVVAGGTGILAVREVSKIAQGTTYNMLGQGSQVKIQGATTANTTMSGSGSLGQVGPTDATSTPTVVEQPAPIIVNQPEPVVVNPVVVGQ